jgi:hypothetical protein
MKIADNYLSGLKKAYYDNGNEETWNHFEQIKHGASKTDIFINAIKLIKKIYWMD